MSDSSFSSCDNTVGTFHEGDNLHAGPRFLVMGPGGGYRFSDHIKLRVPLTLMIFVAGMLLLQLFWPLILVNQ
jgi:hypothetical protein